MFADRIVAMIEELQALREAMDDGTLTKRYGEKGAQLILGAAIETLMECERLPFFHKAQYDG